MSKDAKNVPALRFKGYSDAWEKRKLGELVEIQNGYAFESKYFTEAPTKFVVVTPGSVLIGGGFRFGSGHFYDLNGPVPRDFVFKPGDLFLTLTDLTPSARLLGYSAFVPHDDNVYLHNQRLGKIESIGSSLSFIYYLTSTPSFHNAIVRGASGTTVKHSSKAKVLSYQSEIPFLSEQHQISSFLKKFDDLIAATQHKIDALEQAKKVLLQRLFDQSWRFKDYSDPWEKRKFKNLVVRVNKTSDNSTIPSVEFEDIISKQGRLNKDVRLKVNSKQGIYFEPQDVLFGKLRPYLQNWLFPSFYGRAVGDFWVLRANSSLLSEYLFVLIQSPRFQSVANISSGIKMPRSDWNTVSNTSFSIPVQSEQRRIEQLFNVLDDLIAATQSRLSSLELLKKFLLQNLFI